MMGGSSTKPFDANVRFQPGPKSRRLNTHVSFMIKTIENSAVKSSLEEIIFFMAISITNSIAVERIMNTFHTVYLFDTIDDLY